MPLRNIGSLLPYHSHVDSVVVVSSLNRMIDDASAGRTVFYDIYTDAQKQAEPSRKNTGLFFFRGRPGAPFAVVAPGGGFSYVASVHEGFPYAVEISNRGYNAFVLKYRAGQGGDDSHRGLSGGAFLHLQERELSWRHDAPTIRCGAALRARGWPRRSVPMAPAGLAVRICRSRRPLSSCTPVIRISPQRNLRRSLPLVTPIALHLPPSWKGGLRCCGTWEPKWNITSIPALVMASALVGARAPKDGSRTLFAFGRSR